MDKLDMRLSWGWKVWFAFCGLAGAGVLAGLGFLGLAAYRWMERH